MKALLALLIMQVFLLSVAQAQSASDTVLFPQINNSVKIQRFAGNWNVTLTNKDGSPRENLFISIEPAYERYCDETLEGYCQYRKRYLGSREWEAKYQGVSGHYSQDFALSGPKLFFEHSYGVIGHWGAESIVRFKNGVGQGKWKYGDEDGLETWVRQVPTINRVVFHAVDAPEGVLPASQIDHGQVGTVTGTYDPPRWRESNRAPGTRPAFKVELYGDNLGGFHVFGVKSGLGLDPVGCLMIGGSTKPDNQGIIGLECEVNVWPGVTNDTHVLQLDNIDIPFDMVVDGLPAARKLQEFEVRNLPPVHVNRTVPFLPKEIAQGIGIRNFVAEVRNHGENAAPSMQVEINAGDGSARAETVNFCRETGTDCSPCSLVDEREKDQRYMCSGANLEPGQRAFVVFEFKDPAETTTSTKAPQTSDPTARKCSKPQAQTINIVGHDGVVQEEHNSANNNARFLMPRTVPKTDGIELFGSTLVRAPHAFSGLEPYPHGELYPLEVLYPRGFFVAKLRFREPVCDPELLNGIAFLADTYNARNQRREIRQLTATLSDDKRFLISEPMFSGTPGSRITITAANEKTGVTVEEIPTGHFSLNSTDQDDDKKRQISRYGSYTYRFDGGGADLRNVLSVPFQRHVFHGPIGDLDVAELTTRAGKQVEFKTRDDAVFNDQTGHFSNTSRFFFIGADRLEKDATLAITSFPHGPVRPGMDRLTIVGATKPTLGSIIIKQNGETVRKVAIGTPFTVEARMSKPLVDTNSVAVTFEVQTPNTAQAGANEEFSKILLRSASDNALFSGSYTVAPYSDERDPNFLTGFDRDVLVVRHDEMTAAAGLVEPALEDEEDKLSFTVITNDFFGLVDARGTLSNPGGSSASGKIINFIANNPFAVDAGNYQLNVEIPSCCIYRARVEISEDAADEIEIPALVHLSATSDVLSDDQLSMASVVAERDDFGSELAGMEDKRSSSWQMKAAAYNFKVGNTLSGLDLPPGVYDVQLVHRAHLAKLKKKLTIMSGSERVAFTSDTAAPVVGTTAKKFLDDLQDWERAPTLEPDEDFDQDGIPNEVDTNPRVFSDIAWKPGEGNIPLRILDRNGNKVTITGVSQNTATLTVEGPEDGEPALIELLGVELELTPGTIMEAAFG